MIEISIGCNFTDEHIDAIMDLSTMQRKLDTAIKITSVYGSPGILNQYGSVRPRRREVDLSLQMFERNIARLHSAGLKIKLAFNSLTPYNRQNLDDKPIHNFEVVAEFLAGIWDECWFDQVIVASPGLLDKIDQSIPVMVSTVMNIHGIAQLKYIKDRWPNVTLVCPALWRNRDLEWLSKANQIIPLELLANEFCTLGGVECEGLYRQACYLSQSMDISDWNPMDVCRPSRAKHPESWIKAKFILPDWLHRYKNETGISHYKVTGRTHPAKFIRFIGESYIRGKAKGNLLALWGMLEATYGVAETERQNRVQEEVLNSEYPYIPVERIAESDFYASPICNSENCSVLCEHCTRLYRSIRRSDLG